MSIGQIPADVEKIPHSMFELSNYRCSAPKGVCDVPI